MLNGSCFLQSVVVCRSNVDVWVIDDDDCLLWRYGRLLGEAVEGMKGSGDGHVAGNSLYQNDHGDDGFPMVKGQ